MARASEQQYYLLPKLESASDDDSSTIENGDLNHRDRHTRKERWLRLLKPLVVQVGILAAYTGILFAIIFPSTLKSAQKSCWRQELQYTPMRDAYRYQVKEVGYNFTEVNAFKGRPVEEVNREWESLLNGAHEVRLSEAQLRKMNASSIQLSDGSGDYIVQPVVYHMLHCLYNLYRYVHPEFYGEDASGPEWVVTHTDHCVDNLRQFVQCHGGNGFSTFKWLDWRKPPYPILTTNEVCIDWSHFDGWVREHSVPTEDIASLKGGKLLSHPKFGPLYKGDFE